MFSITWQSLVFVRDQARRAVSGEGGEGGGGGGGGVSQGGGSGLGDLGVVMEGVLRKEEEECKRMVVEEEECKRVQYRHDLQVFIYTKAHTQTHIHIMCVGGVCVLNVCVCRGTEKCNRCDILKNLLDEKGIQYHYLDMMEMPHKTMTFLKMYCNNYPMVLGVNFFSTFTDTLEYLLWWSVVCVFIGGKNLKSLGAILHRTFFHIL